MVIWKGNHEPILDPASGMVTESENIKSVPVVSGHSPIHRVVFVNAPLQLVPSGPLQMQGTRLTQVQGWELVG
jgi:hypothetical protein